MSFMDDFRKGQEKAKRSSQPGPTAETSSGQVDLEQRERDLRERELEQREKEVQKKEAEDKAKKWTGIGCGGLTGLVLLLIVIGALAGGEDGGDQQDGKPQAGEVATPTGGFSCPGQLFVGLPVDFEIRIKNPGTVSYPATFVSLDDGFDRFVINDVSQGPRRLQPADVPGFGDAYVTAGAGVPKKEARVVTVTMTPIEAGNVDLRFWIWTAERDDREVPDDVIAGDCQSIPVNP
jgi:hypothetical protein